MFRGRYETTVDAKGRTSLPARFRETLASSDENQMVLTTALEPCIVAYTYTDWIEFEKKLAEKPGFDEDIVRFKRRFVSSAVDCAVDGHGRILIPPTLRKYAGIAKKVVWSAMLDKVELWDADRLAEFETHDNDPAEIARMREAVTRHGL